MKDKRRFTKYTQRDNPFPDLRCSFIGLVSIRLSDDFAPDRLQIGCFRAEAKHLPLTSYKASRILT